MQKDMGVKEIMSSYNLISYISINPIGGMILMVIMAGIVIGIILNIGLKGEKK
jgi:hypothetical protein